LTGNQDTIVEEKEEDEEDDDDGDFRHLLTLD
jgi:hypothetical protein